LSHFFAKVFLGFLLLLPLTSSPLLADSVTIKTYRELSEIQELMAGTEEVKGDIDTGITRLKVLLTEVAEGSLDEALTLQTLGYAVMSNEDFESAISYLKRSLDTGKLPQQVVYNVGYMVAQLHAALGEFNEALMFAEQWFKNLQQPKSDQYIFMANIYAQVKRYAESAPYAEKAIAASDSPRESWYQLLTADYFELKRFPEAANALSQMIDLWPEKAAYWEQLASIYMIMDRPERALAILKVAFDVGLINKQSTVKSLVQLAMMQGVPEHAGRLLDLAIAAKWVPIEEDYLELLAQAWVNAKEYPNAINTYEKIAVATKSGDPWMKIANIHVQAMQWSKAELAVIKALEEDLKEPGKAWLLLGISQSELGKFDEARTALRKAQAFKTTERSAQTWLRYARSMQRQAQWIAENR
jgi:tetratricopeptide (TPR) repeat protein